MKIDNIRALVGTIHPVRTQDRQLSKVEMTLLTVVKLCNQGNANHRHGEVPYSRNWN